MKKRKTLFRDKEQMDKVYDERWATQDRIFKAWKNLKGGK